MFDAEYWCASPLMYPLMQLERFLQSSESGFSKQQLVHSGATLVRITASRTALTLRVQLRNRRDLAGKLEFGSLVCLSADPKCVTRH